MSVSDMLGRNRNYFAERILNMNIRDDANSKKQVHLIIDFSYLYYKYYFQLESGKLKRLIVKNPPNPFGLIPPECESEIDITLTYYILLEIERLREQWSNKGVYNIVTSICFDSRSARKNSDTEYKANRQEIFKENNFSEMNFIRLILSKIGYNVYKIEGAEADDLIGNLVEETYKQFARTVIATPDADLAVNIRPYNPDTGLGQVDIWRYKTHKHAYTLISYTNFSDTFHSEYKTAAAIYNTIMLYKATVGDKSDNIAGIKGFGPAAFEKMIHTLVDKRVTPIEPRYKLLDLASGLSNEQQYLHTKEILQYFFSKEPSKLEQALKSLELVKTLKLDTGDWDFDASGETEQLKTTRYNIYKSLQFMSILKILDHLSK